MYSNYHQIEIKQHTHTKKKKKDHKNISNLKYSNQRNSEHTHCIIWLPQIASSITVSAFGMQRI